MLGVPMLDVPALDIQKLLYTAMNYLKDFMNAFLRHNMSTWNIYEIIIRTGNKLFKKNLHLSTSCLLILVKSQ